MKYFAIISSILLIILVSSCSTDNEKTTPIEKENKASELLKDAETALIAVQKRAESLPEEKRSELDKEILGLTDNALDEINLSKEENAPERTDYQEAYQMMIKQSEIYNKYGINTDNLDKILEKLNNEINKK